MKRLGALSFAFAMLWAGASAGAMLSDSCQSDSQLVLLIVSDKLQYPQTSKTDSAAGIREFIQGLNDGQTDLWTDADDAKVSKLVDYSFKHLGADPKAAAAGYLKICGSASK
jgi:hypothetical protein